MFTIQNCEAYHALLATENELNLSTRLIYGAITLRKKILIIVFFFLKFGLMSTNTLKSSTGSFFC